MTNRFTLYLTAGFNALKRPFLAGSIIEFSSGKFLNTTGDAMWITRSQPLTASSHPLSSLRSNWQNSRFFSSSSSTAFLISASLAVDLIDVRTENPFFKNLTIQCRAI